jgi:hypothetical protein
MSEDPDLGMLRFHRFSYLSPKFRLPGLPSRIPDYDDIAQTLPTYLDTDIPEPTAKIAILTHSQGGLILQRFLAWMLAEGRGRDLARIRLIVMLACPNEGSEYLRSIRAMTGFGRHPQAKALRVLDADVGEARRIVLRQIINATTVDDRHCPIPFYVYSGSADNVVRRESAQSVFPKTGVLPGDHFSILNPNMDGSITLPALKKLFLSKIVEQPPNSGTGQGEGRVTAKQAEPLVDQPDDGRAGNEAAQDRWTGPPIEIARENGDDGSSLYEVGLQLRRRALGALRVPQSEIDSVKDLLSDSSTGIVKLMNDRQMLEGVGIRGGGAYYDFVRRDQEYNYGSDISLRDGSLTTGFAGLDYGYILRLGRIPLREILVESPEDLPPSLPRGARDAWRFMWEYRPPRDVKQLRLQQGEAETKVVGNTSLSSATVAEENASYLLRALQISRHDILVALHIQRILRDGSVILVWKILKIFDTPVAVGSED